MIKRWVSLLKVNYKLTSIRQRVSVASNGVMYRTDKQGLIPALLTKWFDERVEMRKLVKKFNEEGDKDKEQYFDRRQYLQKIVIEFIVWCIRFTSI